jgi:predicted RNA-binding protein associated with RNAse of E/G family
MLLDLWFFPDARHIVLDEDEVEECFCSGLLSEDDKEYIEKSKETALAEFAVNAQRLSLALQT